MFLDERRNPIERRMVAAHAEDAVGDDDGATAGLRGIGEALLQLRQVEMADRRGASSAAPGGSR